MLEFVNNKIIKARENKCVLYYITVYTYVCIFNYSEGELIVLILYFFFYYDS